MVNKKQFMKTFKKAESIDIVLKNSNDANSIKVYTGDFAQESLTIKELLLALGYKVEELAKKIFNKTGKLVKGAEQILADLLGKVLTVHYMPTKVNNMSNFKFLEVYVPQN